TGSVSYVCLGFTAKPENQYHVPRNREGLAGSAAKTSSRDLIDILTRVAAHRGVGDGARSRGENVCVHERLLGCFLPPHNVCGLLALLPWSRARMLAGSFDEPARRRRRARLFRLPMTACDFSLRVSVGASPDSTA